MKRFAMILTLLSFAFAQNGTLALSKKQAEYIAKKVWQNEGAGKDKYLIWWNDGEDFMSLGIGHFIWFPRGHTERFREVFPMVLAYMIQHGAKPPVWLRPETDAPWNSKAELMRAKKIGTQRYKELFSFLKRTMGLQASFMAQRMVEALPQMLDRIDDPKRRKIVARRFRQILYNSDGSVDERGLYILIDYVNFKGEGTLESERYNGQGWGLLQVLEHMNEHAPNKYKAFADSAKAMLERRIRNAPPKRGEARWRKGWFKRLDTYWK
jgi:hypothetical protein